RSRVKPFPPASVADTAASIRFAAAGSPTWSSSMAALRTTAIGFARPFPAMSGALPCTASNTAYRAPRFAPGTRPNPPTNPPHTGARDGAPKRFLHPTPGDRGGAGAQSQAEVADRHRGEPDDGDPAAPLGGALEKQAARQAHDVGFGAEGEELPPAAPGELE